MTLCSLDGSNSLEFASANRRRAARTRSSRPACRGRARSTGCSSRARTAPSRSCPRHPSRPKPPGTQMPSTSDKERRGAPLLDVRALDPAQVHARVVRGARVDDASITLLYASRTCVYFTDDRDLALAAGMRDAAHERAPRRESGGCTSSATAGRDICTTGSSSPPSGTRWHFVWTSRRSPRSRASGRHVAEQRDLLAHVGVERATRSGEQDVRLDADLAQPSPSAASASSSPRPPPRR